MKVSRSTILLAYAELEEEGLIYALKGKGNYVSTLIETQQTTTAHWQLDWTEEVSDYAIQAEQYDLMKHGSGAERGEISFTSIAPDEKLFDLHNVKRAFLDRMSLEGEFC